MRIHAAEITPDGALVIVAGPNDAGKSSVMQAISYALFGAKAKIAQPIRQGATKAEIVLQTDELTITRTISASGSCTFEVRDTDNNKITSPQTKLDTLFRLTTFDPLTFTKMEPKAQATTLRDLAGLDTSDIDTEYQQKFAARTEAGRKRDDQQGRVNAIVRDTTAPKEPVIVASLTKQLQEANEANAANDRKREALADLNDAIASANNIVDLRKKYLAEIRAKLHQAEADLGAAEKEQKDATEARDAAKAEVDALADVDTASILEQIQGAEAINTKVRANAEWETEHTRLVQLQGDYQKLTEALAGLMGTRESRIAKAKFPVEGLALTDDGVTFDGVPFQQCSSSKQIRVSLAIACALNPELRVMLIRDGSLLDEKSLALVQEFAEKHDACVFMECVGQREDATVIIEAGRVVATPLADKKNKAKAGK